MFGRKKPEPTKVERKPYDYQEQARLLEEGDIYGLQHHMLDAPAGSWSIYDMIWTLVPIIVKVHQNYERKLEEARDATATDPLG